MNVPSYPIPPQVATMGGDCHHVIEASAGTGKTFLIEHRVVDLILREGAKIDDILVVTFTEKATAELRSRIRALLARIAETETQASATEPHWVIDEAAKKRLRDALYACDRAAIYTIHGFCHRLLREQAFVGGQPFEQEQVAREQVASAAFMHELRHRFAKDEDYREPLRAWLENHSLDSLRELVTRKLKDGGVEPPEVEHQEIEGLMATRPPAPADDPTQLAELCRAEGLKGTQVAATGRHLSVVRALFRRPHIAYVIEDAAKAAKSIEYLVDRIPASSTPLGQFTGWLAQLRKVLPSPHSYAATLFSPAVFQRMKEDKERLRVLDFADMLEQVAEALSGPRGPQLAANLRTQHRFALIDEFQDTDELQWEIFRRIYVAQTGAYLTIVGDPKQAIYSFRGADLATYFQAREELLSAGAQLTTLRTNYRSTPALVESVNSILRSEPLSFFTGGVSYDNPVKAAKEHILCDADGEPVPAVDLIDCRETGLKLAGAQLALRDFIAREIETLVRNPKAKLYLDEGQSRRELGPGDIFVLTRSTKESEAVAADLKGRGVPCVLYKQEGLLTSPEADDTIALLSAIARPHHRASRLQAWQSRYFGIALSELGALGDIPDGSPLVTRLYDWKEMADRRAYEEMFASILSRSGIVERELLTAPTARGLTNILHLFEILAEDAANSRCEIAELARRLSRWQLEAVDSPSDDRNLQRIDSDRDAVQIMTVHKSKGLEAGIVFLYGGFRAPPRQSSTYRSGGKRRTWLGKVPKHIAKLVEEHEVAEEERLLYVAITRAVGKLYLPHLELPITGYYRWLDQRLRGMKPPDFRPRNVALESQDEKPEAKLDGWTPHLPRREENREAWSLAQNRRGFIVTSYTHLKKRSQVEEKEFSMDAAPPAVEGELPGGAASGIFIHELLEHADLKAARELDFEAWRSDERVSELVHSAMIRHGIDGEYADSSFDMTYRGLRCPVGDLAAVCEWSRIAREREFLYPLPGRGNGFVRGFVDLIGELDGKVYALDWKTDRLPSYDADTIGAHVERHYGVQVDLYANAIVKSLVSAEQFGGLLYCFVRGMDEHGAGVYRGRPNPETLNAKLEIAAAGVLPKGPHA